MNLPYRIGLPQWHHEKWYAPDHTKVDSLSVYSRSFSSVEGNNTFYGLPSEASITQWRDQTPKGFKFCFKFPRTISHDAQLLNCNHEVEAFFARINPLADKIGIVWLQLSHQFSPEQLAALDAFLERLPKQILYAVEVRHRAFFEKGLAEKTLNQLLIKHQVNRVIFDTRTLFASPSDDAETLAALQDKPRVPTHVIATGNAPLIRFIGPHDTHRSQANLTPWLHKTLEWIDQGKTPYLFFHTPGNASATTLAQWFSEQIHQLRPEIPAMTLWNTVPKQGSLW